MWARMEGICFRLMGVRDYENAEEACWGGYGTLCLDCAVSSGLVD